jgi:hypothetical protein
MWLFSKKRNKISRDDLWLLMFEQLFPDEYQKLRRSIEKYNTDDSWAWCNKHIGTYEHFLNLPKILGYSILCTYEDPYADSGQDDSEFAFYLLISNGQIIHVDDLGLHSGIFSKKVPPALQLFAKKLPEIKPYEMSCKAPQCFDEVRKISKDWHLR